MGKERKDVDRKKKKEIRGAEGERKAREQDEKDGRENWKARKRTRGKKRMRKERESESSEWDWEWDDEQDDWEDCEKPEEKEKDKRKGKLKSEINKIKGESKEKGGQVIDNKIQSEGSDCEERKKLGLECVVGRTAGRLDR